MYYQPDVSGIWQEFWGKSTLKQTWKNLFYFNSDKLLKLGFLNALGIQKIRVLKEGPLQSVCLCLEDVVLGNESTYSMLYL